MLESVHHLIWSDVKRQRKSGCQESDEDLACGALVFLPLLSEHRTSVVSVLLPRGSPSCRISFDKARRCCEVRELILTFLVVDVFCDKLHSFSNLKIIRNYNLKSLSNQIHYSF